MIPAARPIIGDEERAAVDRVLRSGMMAQGPEVKAFEEEFSQFVDGRRCIAVNSGTSALHLGFLAAGIKPGDEVIVPSFSFAATANSVALAGAVPVFGDIDPKTFNLDPDHVETLITPRTKAIMPVHLYGHPAHMDEIMALAKKHNLLVVEDAAEAIGGKYKNKHVGTFGEAATFSFFGNKTITTGGGGMIITSDATLAKRARHLTTTAKLPVAAQAACNGVIRSLSREFTSAPALTSSATISSWLLAAAQWSGRRSRLSAALMLAPCWIKRRTMSTWPALAA